MMRVLIVGCGYVGVPLGAALAALGHEVYGLRRHPAAAAELQAAGIRPLTGDVRLELVLPDGTRGESSEALPALDVSMLPGARVVDRFGVRLGGVTFRAVHCRTLFSSTPRRRAIAEPP